MKKKFKYSKQEIIVYSLIVLCVSISVVQAVIFGNTTSIDFIFLSGVLLGGFVCFITVIDIKRRNNVI